MEKETGLRVVLEPEVLSSREAMHIQGDNEMNDASAAAIVLQGYLDRNNIGRDVEDNDA
jgi:RNase H-fold protein (predicted Holliday junction resolvase)